MKPNLTRLRSALTTKQAELLQGLQNREGIVIQPAPEDMDQAQHAADRDLKVSKLNLDSALLRSVRAALHRLDEGHYGCCLHCDEAIGSKRLAAVPWAAYCIECQAAADRGEFEEVVAATTED